MDVSLEAKTKPLAALSAFSYVTPRRNEPKQMSYFNNEVSDVSMYDRLHNHVEGYDMRLPRDDRKHWKGRGLDINKEFQERSRTVPVLSSSEYGRRPAPTLYFTERQYARVACIKSEIYMKNGILWSVEEGYGSVRPS
uniref:Cilia and flagella associated protein 90 n=1 Tax=Neolamprologus brichardi TaxID=32507 RepID=A0A3Q4GG82_NEOBR